ncbi:hypothetical protein RHSIM_Rhsim03G0004300 [Rhododendron simsii]|uniref:Bifunctional inhibitor/plant lipid transfer protein/seed storage helical domain-containing protein n=1 Tax=Rhododendron simsii TaxID=118357 RepID=A0A834H9A2_RHOSS|nr:hypothetical protein RHSIM_Rhsim03G0004300 [Rhododendron simsii]
MGTTIPATIILAVVLLIGAHVSSDIVEDKRECQDQLVGLAPCLNYASGDIKTPSPTCCTELRQKYNSTERCLCLLVKDRNDPGLGFKINGTLALTLPYICHAHPNISHCPGLLHLAPGSPDAQIFEDFARSLAANSSDADASSGVEEDPKNTLNWTIFSCSDDLGQVFDEA